MNILFHTFGKIEPTKGGTERTTITTATGLTHLYGCRCYSVYEEQSSSPMAECFVDEYNWSIVKDEEVNVRFLRNILINCCIDCVIIQGAFIHVKRYRKAVEGLQCKIVFAHHFEPGWEKVFYNFKDIFSLSTNIFYPPFVF